MFVEKIEKLVVRKEGRHDNKLFVEKIEKLVVRKEGRHDDKK